MALLLGGVAVLGSILIFRKGLLPLIDAAFHPGPEWLSVFRRVGISLTAVGGYWAFVHWHEKRQAAELRLRPLHLLLGGASGAAMGALKRGQVADVDIDLRDSGFTRTIRLNRHRRPGNPPRRATRG